MFEATFRITAQVKSDGQGRRVFRITEREAPANDAEFLSRLEMMYRQEVYTSLLAGDDLTVAVRLDLPPREVEKTVHLREDRLFEGEGMPQATVDPLPFMQTFYEPLMQRVEPGDVFTITFRVQRPQYQLRGSPESWSDGTGGLLEQARHLLTMTGGCHEFNTSLIERFNATMRERLASLTRKCRHAAGRVEVLETGMQLIGCTYNFCFPHHELSNATHFGYACTPAMAAGLADHIWTIQEVLTYKIAPSPWVEPQPARQPRKKAVPDPMGPKRPRGRPRKHPLPDPTVPKRPRGRPRKVA